ncbi:MAG: hypothetical protein WKG00_35945 [Polyangiaceae bacterium]|jgi:hypothetical protein
MQGHSAAKRRKEQQRQQKQKEKEASRAEKKKNDDRPKGEAGEDPDLAGIVPGPQPIQE